VRYTHVSIVLSTVPDASLSTRLVVVECVNNLVFDDTKWLNELALDIRRKMQTCYISGRTMVTIRRNNLEKLNVGCGFV